VQNVHESSMRKLYTECDLRRVGHEGLQSCSSRLDEGLQSCSSRLVETTNISVPPAVTDTLAAAPPPDYGSFAPRRRLHTVDDDHDDEACSPPITDFMSFEMPSSAASSRWRWTKWRPRRAWLNFDAVTLANSIDKYSRVGFPFIFVVLSVIYWVVYLLIRPAGYEDDFVIVD